MTQYPSYKKFLEAKLTAFEHLYYNDLRGEEEPMQVEIFEKFLREALLEAVEAGIAAATNDLSAILKWNAERASDIVWDVEQFPDYMDNAALLGIKSVAGQINTSLLHLDAEKRAKSWLEK